MFELTVETRRVDALAKKKENAFNDGSLETWSRVQTFHLNCNLRFIFKCRELRALICAMW